MDKTKYNEYVQSWMETIQENCMKDAELTLKLCNDVIEYGNKIEKIIDNINKGEE